MHAAEPLPHFVDDYLSFLYEVHPTGATMDGVHIHDDQELDGERCLREHGGGVADGDLHPGHGVASDHADRGGDPGLQPDRDGDRGGVRVGEGE